MKPSVYLLLKSSTSLQSWGQMGGIDHSDACQSIFFRIPQITRSSSCCFKAIIYPKFCFKQKNSSHHGKTVRALGMGSMVLLQQSPEKCQAHATPLLSDQFFLMLPHQICLFVCFGFFWKQSLMIQLRLALNSQGSSCLSFPYSRIAGMYLHAWV